jgi:hypothetical protein
MKDGTTRSKKLVQCLRDEVVIYSDEINIQSSKHRDEFAGFLVGLGCDRDTVLTELLSLAEQAANESSSGSPGPSFSDEIDASLVYRPERIISPEVSAIAVPILGASPTGVHGRWKLYMATAEGRQSIELAPVFRVGEQKYFIEVIPPDPGVGDAAGWSRRSRTSWLAGEAAVDPAELFEQVFHAIDRYVDFPADKRHGYLALLTCWVVLSYSYHAWSAVPYLLVNGPAGSGKSTLFEILKMLTFRPMATDNISAAAIFRTLHNFGGTLLFDEAERLRDTKSESVVEINSMLLAGYQRGRGATRLEKIGDGFKTVSFNVYGPKAIACINGVLPALQTRCIEIRTHRASGDSPKPKRVTTETDWQSLRDALHVLAIENGPAWLAASTRRDIGQRLNGRDFELWQPLLAIASFFQDAGMDDLLRLLEATAIESTADSAEMKTPEADETILSVLAEAITEGIWVGKEDKRRQVFQPISEEILEACRARSPAAFEKFTPTGIGIRLRAYGLRTGKSGKRREYRVTEDKLKDIQDRYSIDLGF